MLSLAHQVGAPAVITEPIRLRQVVKETSPGATDRLGIRPSLDSTGVNLLSCECTFGSGQYYERDLILFHRAPGGTFAQVGTIARDQNLQNRSRMARDGLRLIFNDGFGPAATKVYERVVTTWSLTNALTPTLTSESADAGYGIDITTGIAVVGVPNAQRGGQTVGQAVTFRKSGGTWNEAEKIDFGDLLNGRFGEMCRFSADGIYLAIADRPPTSYRNIFICKWTGSTWVLQSKTSHSSIGDFCLSDDGSLLFVADYLAGSGTGRIAVFSRSGTAWSSLASLAGLGSAGEQLGLRGIRCSTTGKRVVASSGNGALLFRRNGNTWPRVYTYALAGSVYWPTISGDEQTIALGDTDDDSVATNSGAIDTFETA